MAEPTMYRGMDKYTNTWVHGVYVKHLPYTPYPDAYPIDDSEYQHLIIAEGTSDFNMPRNLLIYPVLPDTVQEYSGFKDKKGKSIYEWDHVVVDYDYAQPKDTYVILDRGVWYLAGEDLATGNEMLLQDHSQECEVTGNDWRKYQKH